MSNDTMLLAVISSLAGLIILYLLIKNGMSAGNKKALAELKLQNRLKVKQMLKEGFTLQELEGLTTIYHDEHFWQRLKATLQMCLKW